jgi:hypothetical protein
MLHGGTRRLARGRVDSDNCESDHVYQEILPTTLALYVNRCCPVLGRISVETNAKLFVLPVVCH